jgi:hypothetical protein
LNDFSDKNTLQYFDFARILIDRTIPGAHLRPAPVFHRYQRYVGIGVRLGIRDVL